MSVIVEFFKRVSISSILIGIVMLVVGFYVGKITTEYTLNKQYSGINDKLTIAQQMAKDTLLEKEKLLIEIAKKDAALSKPVVAQTETKVVTEYVYKEKENVNDADVKITGNSPVMKLDYYGKVYNLEAQRTNNNSEFKGGTLVTTQNSEFKIDVTDIVNREIATTINKSEHEIAVLKRQKTQQTIWGVLGGAALGIAIEKTR